MDYTKEFKSMFAEINLSIPQLPAKYIIPGIKKPLKPLVFKLPDSFWEYTEIEFDFWNENFADLKGQQPFSAFVSNLANARKSFDAAYIASNDFSNSNEQKQQQARNLCKQKLDETKNFLTKNDDAQNIYSKTILAKELTKNKEKTINFFSGFFYGIEQGSNNDRAINNTSRDFIFGLCTAHGYIQTILDIDKKLPDAIADIENMKADFHNRSNEYLDEYDSLLETKVNDFQKLEHTITEDEKKRAIEFESFVKKSGDNIGILENTYEEKLKLAEPAKYWQTMSDNYNKNGKNWLVVTSIGSFIGITILAFLMVFTNAFDGEDTVQAVRNMAILSVIITAVMYVIRTFVKVAMSSFHLARDAKEREQLAYFYLSLSNNNLIDKNERELVLSALFSRSDTGLLKGDSSRELPSATKITGNIVKE